VAKDEKFHNSDSWLKWRNIVINRRRPGKLFVQPNTVWKENGGKGSEMISRK
jgi:Peptidase family M49